MSTFSHLRQVRDTTRAIVRTADVLRSDFRRLEDRVLMSASPLDIHPETLDQLAGAEDSDIQRIFAPLSGGGSSGAPEVVPFDVLVVGEDHNNSEIDLGLYFNDATTIDAELIYELVGNTDPSLFSSIDIDGQALTLDYAPNAFGVATLAVRATDADGNQADLELDVAALPVNDRPTTTGFTDITVVHAADSTVIDLFAMFDDLEDADQELTYTLTENTNASLFSSIDVDLQTGLMTLEFAPGAIGTSQLTIRATDTAGAFVEMDTAGAEFSLYSSLAGVEGVDFPAGINFQTSKLLTGWHFGHENVPDSEIDETHYRSFLSNMQGPSDQLVVLDLEDPAFADNTPEARENLANAINILAEERPDLTRVGFYRLMPERNYWAPSGVAAAENLIELGVNAAWATNYLADRQVIYDEWVERNTLYREEPLADGTLLADKVSVVNPSLYTFYGNSSSSQATLGAVFAPVTSDAATNTFTLEDNYVVSGMQVSVVAEDVGFLPTELDKTLDYFVVNSTLDTFQLALTRDGEAIDFGLSGGRQYLKVASEYPGHDPYYQGWVDRYAEPNMEEARKFGKEAVAFLLPKFSGVDDYLDQNFFRMQLDAMYELADGINIFNSSVTSSGDPANQGWWQALTEFQDYLNSPTQFTVTIEAPTVPEGSDFFVINEDQALSIGGAALLANDNLGIGDVVSVSLASDPVHAQSFELLEDGSFSYTPTADYAGIDEFTYTVQGTLGVTQPISVSITILPINDAPTIVGIPPHLFSSGQSMPTIVGLTTLFDDVDHSSSEIVYEVSQGENDLNFGVTIGGVDADQLIFDPTNSNLGVTQITVRAIDAAGAETNLDFDVQVARIFAPLATAGEPLLGGDNSTSSQVYRPFAQPDAYRRMEFQGRFDGSTTELYAHRWALSHRDGENDDDSTVLSEFVEFELHDAVPILFTNSTRPTISKMGLKNRTSNSGAVTNLQSESGSGV